MATTLGHHPFTYYMGNSRSFIYDSSMATSSSYTSMARGHLWMDTLLQSYFFDDFLNTDRLYDWYSCRANCCHSVISSTCFTRSFLSASHFIAKHSDYRIGTFTRHLVRFWHVAESNYHCPRLFFPNHNRGTRWFTTNRQRLATLFENVGSNKSPNILEVAMAICSSLSVFRAKNCGYL